MRPVPARAGARVRVSLSHLEAAPVDVPAGGYSAVLADPAWPFVNRGGRGSAGAHYADVQTREDLAAMPVRDIVAHRAVLGLWITEWHALHGWAASIVESWGFDALRMSSIAWVKRRAVGPSEQPRTVVDPRDLAEGWRLVGPVQIGIGTVVRACTERLVIATRNWTIPTDARPWGLMEWPARGRGIVHSQKPDAGRLVVERAAPPGPRIELNARRSAPGWDAWGKEAPEHGGAQEEDEGRGARGRGCGVGGRARSDAHRV